MPHAPAQHPRPLVSRLSCSYPALPWFWLPALFSPVSRPLSMMLPLPSHAWHGQREHPPARDPFGCRLVGPASHRLDSRGLGCGGGHSLEPAHARKIAPVCLPPGGTRSIGPAAVPLNASRGRVFLFFHEAPSSSFRLVHHGSTSRSHLLGHHDRCFGCSAGEASRSHPFS
jgi:hypothetical protein